MNSHDSISRTLLIKTFREAHVTKTTLQKLRGRVEENLDRNYQSRMEMKSFFIAAEQESALA